MTREHMTRRGIQNTAGPSEKSFSHFPLLEIKDKVTAKTDTL